MNDTLVAMLREEMVQMIAAHAMYAREQIGKERFDKRVMVAMAKVPRHDFVPIELAPFAYADQPLPIGYDKTISQPFIVALMTDLLEIGPGHRVLEIGTGLGYHTAVLAELAAEVYSVEIVEELAEQARNRLAPLGRDNIVLRIGNGEHGWPEHAPFDRIVVCAASELIPHGMISQLKPGGRMVVPTGLPDAQTLMVVERTADGRTSTQEILPVRFALLETAN